MIELSTYPFLALSPSQALDIWPAFDGSSGSNWPANTYAAFIAGADATFAAELSSGKVVKTDWGVCSDGSRHLYTYEAGEGTDVTLIIGGMHADERLGMFGAARWFERFVKDSHPLMVVGRATDKVIWLPFANPSTFGSSRKNSNGVDPNRNFNFYWNRFAGDGGNPASQFYKGTAAFSEPEPTIIKAIIDTKNVQCFIDCHNMGVGESTKTIEIQAPSAWGVSKRRLNFAAAEQWAKLYGGTWEDLEPEDLGIPNGVSWASDYIVGQLGRRNGASFLVETVADLSGSSTSLMTAEAMRMYCGYITTAWLTWKHYGRIAPTSQPIIWRTQRSAEAASTSIATGGTLVDTNAQTRLTFDTFQPGTGSRNYLDALYRGPGILRTMAGGYVEGGGTADTRLDFAFHVATPPSFTFSTDNDSQTSITVPSNALNRANFVLSRREFLLQSGLSGDNRRRIGLLVTRLNGGDNVKLKRFWMEHMFVPSDEIEKTPSLNA